MQSSKMLSTNSSFSFEGFVSSKDDQFPLVVPGKILIQKSGLGVPDVQVARRFWRKAGHDVPFRSPFEIDVEGASSVFTACSLGIFLTYLTARLRALLQVCLPRPLK